MATSTEGVKYQANFKTVGGALLNVYAENYGEFEEQLDNLGEAVAKIIAVESLLRQVSGVATTLPTAPPSQQPAQPAPQGNGWGAPPAPQAPTQGHSCAHGPMRLVPAGTSKNTGKPYKAFYACSADRNDPTKCKSISVG